MTIGEIFDAALKLGREADPRGEDGIRRVLERNRKQYEKLTPDEREEFDRERLEHPYSDTVIAYGEPGRPVRGVLVGIDIDPAEILLADKLRERGKPIDLVISHHPVGKGLAALDEVMHLQADLLHQHGVPINVAEGVMAERIEQVRRGISSINHNQAVDMARALDIPLLCIHTPADNLAYQFIKRHLEGKNLDTVGDVVKAIKEVPEYQEALKHSAGPRIFVGNPEGRAGKIAVTEFTGGTEGAKEIYEKMAQAGVGTIVGMHMREENREEAKKHHLNVVVAGHMSSDSLGMNQILDILADRGIAITPISGLIRVDRRAAVRVEKVSMENREERMERAEIKNVEPKTADENPLPEEPDSIEEEF